jgi:quinol monooxygenase YgiN
MLCLNVFLIAKDVANVDTIRSLLQQAMQLSRGEPGCLRFDVYHSTADVRRFTLVEHWESQDALDAHRWNGKGTRQNSWASTGGLAARQHKVTRSYTAPNLMGQGRR